MGVKFARDYDDIVHDLFHVFVQVNQHYEFMGMDEQDWLELSDDQKQSCLKTMADDVVFALGERANIEIGASMVHYDRQHHAITINDQDNVTHIIPLV